MHSSNTNVIRANPLLQTYRKVFVIWCFILVFYGIVIIVMAVVFIQEDASTRLADFMHGSFYLFLFLLYLCTFVSMRLQQRYWERIERRRKAAVEGDHSLLAIEQPATDAVTLQLPFTVSLRYSKESIPLLIGIALLFALYLAATFAWLVNIFLFISPDRFHNFLVLFACMFALMVIFLLAIVLLPAGRQKFTVTEQGLSTRYANQNGVVKWEEARLFAMYPTLGAQKSGASISYELSSATDIARWIWVQPRSRDWRISLVPTVPFDEYQREMQAINALIIGRTGLSLFDLRTEPVADLPHDLASSASRRVV